MKIKMQTFSLMDCGVTLTRLKWYRDKLIITDSQDSCPPVLQHRYDPSQYTLHPLTTLYYAAE